MMILFLCTSIRPMKADAKEDEVTFQRILSMIENPEPMEQIFTDEGSVIFDYNELKERIQKTYFDKVVNYVYEDGVLISENGENTIEFFYSWLDDICLCTKIVVNEESYTLTYDEEYNVECICDKDGSVICQYKYTNTFPQVFENKFGTFVLNEEDSFIGNINPIRYQGWYFDKECGHYYLGEGIYYDAVNCLYVNNPYMVKRTRSAEPEHIQAIAQAYSYFMSSPTYGAKSFANNCVSKAEWNAGERWYDELESTEVIARCIFAENDGLKEAADAGTSKNNGYYDRVAEAVVIMNRVESGMDEDPYAAVTRKSQFSTINPGSYSKYLDETVIARRAKSKTNSAWKEATLLACTLSYTTDSEEFEYMRTIPEYIDNQKYFVGLNYIYSKKLFTISDGMWYYNGKPIEDVALAGVALLEPEGKPTTILKPYYKKGFNIFFNYVE